MSLKKAFRYWSVLLLVVGLAVTAAGEAQAFPVRVVTPLFEIKGGPGAKFHQPTDLVVGRKGWIYVLDGVYDRVQVFDENGKFLFKFGKSGSKDGEFKRPVGLGIDRQGNIYVADSQNHRIQVFDSKGKFLRKLVLKKQKGRAAPDPTDVLVLSPPDEREKIYIADNDNHRILVYDREAMKFDFSFGKPGFAEDGKFRYPHNMAHDSEYNVYIVDVLNTRAQVFKPNGQYIRDIGGWGVREGTFFRPKGVAVDAVDRVYVSDSYMGVVQVFTKDGTYLAVLGNKKRQEWKFNTPISIYIDSSNRLYVVEELGHKVSVFKLP